ncbi:hypothetical protein Kpol_348p3 [Vanderwaltozyma polyspora DSM 70294]|uniref:Peroxisomal hydratase-dehydrogenase-epimerase n=1 Tax=Vanderwaltozyma polyspora (strain ATCC 22028 / DSM 70294 / BCRC 21397 / CBS 2163 / NBRC 10782 / NRRL Y-8283 / UCD 57-17) TaxID=436907 RepID=A7TS49_VANPO|nr:uncharacterized protein Kpol_348p3 [Vanderwaltozyma polyspora DSM 70294]EDO14899.1 hypothetical protein Kpol_348p3 [Vanderwaltozyma polyspora DSM 70294]
MSELSFKDKVVVITGAGGGLGRVYALEYAKRGANVVVNDLGGTLSGANGSTGHRAADLVVKEIKEKYNGKAVANYDSVNADGEKIIKTAIDSFGRIDILINNAGILRDVSFNKMTEKDFQSVVDVHLNGSYKLTKAAWPYMRKQKFGRIINTASPAGLFGNFGQSNYSAAKMGLVGFAETLAKEGYKYNIFVNSIAPLAKSRMTENIIPPHILKNLGPEKIAPLVLYLTHDTTKVTNSTFELAGGFYGQIRWERSAGQIFNPTSEDSFTPEAILNKWNEITDFKNDKPFNKKSHPVQLSDYNDLIVKAKQLPAQNDQGSVKVDSLKGKVVIVTGAGGGLGKSHATWFAKYGAKVVVNDIKDPSSIVNELNAKYGANSAVANTNNIITESDKIVQTAISTFGRIDILVNNAGILRDRSFVKMTDEEWYSVIAVHLLATFAMSKAVWPHFTKQNSGFIINTTSTSGIYGNFGQANYAAAKSAIIGFTKSLAIEGFKKGIRVNVIAPHAETAMTKTIFGDKEFQNHFEPSQVSPFVVLLASQELQAKAKRGVTGQMFEVGGGWVGQTRWQRSPGYVAVDDEITPELIQENWKSVVDFSGKTTNPASTEQSSMLILQSVQAAQAKADGSDGSFSYTHRDAILYNLGLGATTKELNYVYENDPNFQVLPTFAVIPFMNATAGLKFNELVNNFNYAMLLHGEQYIKLSQYPLPTKASLKTVIKPLQVVEKGGKAAVIVGASETYCTKTKKLLCYNEGTMFIRGATVGPNKTIKNNRAKFATQPFKAPTDRKPDYEVEVTTSEDQAAIYRLSGDYNPLHVDPKLAKKVGFPRPILHGLCTLGVSAKALLEKYGQFTELKVRFSNVVFPGDKLKIKAWKQPDGVVIFQTIDETRGVIVLDNAALKLAGSSKL